MFTASHLQVIVSENISLASINYTELWLTFEHNFRIISPAEMEVRA